MRLLAIETSCDETGVAVVEGTKTAEGFVFKNLGAALYSQAALHAPYGGVYPHLAKREHQQNLPAILSQALEKAGLEDHTSIDAIAVTHGPGLEPALWSGITFAQDLAQTWNVPLLPINHMEGHLISSLAQPSSENAGTALERVALPVLALLVSGGHTEFIVMTDWFRYERIGETLDDAVGECFDKVARMLGLPYPGGPQISRLASQARKENLPPSGAKLPRPMLHSGNCDVSFSGLKTAALYALRDLGGADALSQKEKAAFAREFEDAVAEVFATKTRRALTASGAETFVLGGGVAANTHLRQTLVDMLTREFPGVEVRLPELSITGDNAVMIAQAALTHLLSGDWPLETPREDIRAVGNLSL